MGWFVRYLDILGAKHLVGHEPVVFFQNIVTQHEFATTRQFGFIS
jgi:hypothetical protein